MLKVKGGSLKKKGKTNRKSNTKEIVNKINKIWNMSTDDPIPAPAPVSKPVQTLAVAPATETSGASATDTSVPAPAPLSKTVQTLAVAPASDASGSSTTDASVPAPAPVRKAVQTLAVAPATNITEASASDASIPASARVSKPVQTLVVAPATDTTKASTTNASIPASAAPAPVNKPVQTLVVAPATDTTEASATDASIPAPTPVSKPVQTLVVAPATDTTEASATDASIPAPDPVSRPVQTLAVASGTDTTGASATDASVPAPAPVSKPVQTLAVAPATDTTGASAHVKGKGRNNSNCMPGYIFLCNGKTKPHCFQYCVFGLPISKKRTVKKIKPGTKLFLFDYEMRLLHGIYEATSEGKIDLEPTAFEGKFPAQVKYRIVEDWPPLPEKSFKSAIKENYQGVKFRSELSEPQVNTLVLLFRTLSSSSSKPLAMPFPNAAPPQAMLPLRMEDQYNHSIRLHSQGIVEPQPIQTMQNQHHMASALVDHVHCCFQHQSVPDGIGSYNAHSQELYSTSGHTHIVQEPFPRYCSEGVLQYHTMGLGSDHHPLPLWSEPLQRGHCPPQQENIWYHREQPLFEERETTLNRSVAACALVPTTGGILSTVQPYAPANEMPELTYPVPSAYVPSTMQPHAPASGRPVQSYSLPTDHYFSSQMQPYAPASGRPELYHPLPTAPYVSSAMQPCNPTFGRPEENYPMPTASYASSTTQPYAPAFGRPEPHYPLLTAPCVSSTMQPYAPSFGRPEPNVSVSSHFTFVGANQVIR